MQTRKIMFGTRTEFSTIGTDLGSVVRFDSNNFNTFEFSFVLDKALQLIEAPVTNPIIHFPTSVLFPNSFEVFHHNLVSIEIGNNIFTNVVINPLHPTSFSSRDFLKQSLTGTSAFTLKFGTQIFEFSFDLLDIIGIIEPTVRTDSKVIYSEVNAQNNVLRTTVLLSGINLFREREQEETSAFFIYPQQTLFDIPTEVFFVAVWDGEFELLPTFEQSQYQYISFEISTSWEIVSNRSMFNDGIGFSLLNHPTSLFQTSHSNLRRQFVSLPDSVINFVMEFDIIIDFMLPSIINTKLQSFSISFDSPNNFISWIDPNFSSDSCSHKVREDVELFKSFENKEVKGLIHPTAKAVGILSPSL